MSISFIARTEIAAHSRIIVDHVMAQAMGRTFDSEWQSEPATAQIVAFLEEIGIPVAPADLPEPTFLPGILLAGDRLKVDPSRLAYPGDLLHEAGHIAVMTPSRRAATASNAGKSLGDEIAAICWSWAALHHLGLPPETVFHPHGYRGASAWFIASFSSGSYPGLPLLQWMGLTLDAQHAEAAGVAPFPHMVRWLCADDDPH